MILKDEAEFENKKWDKENDIHDEPGKNILKQFVGQNNCELISFNESEGHDFKNGIYDAEIMDLRTGLHYFVGVEVRIDKFGEKKSRFPFLHASLNIPKRRLRSKDDFCIIVSYDRKTGRYGEYLVIVTKNTIREYYRLKHVKYTRPYNSNVSELFIEIPNDDPGVSWKKQDGNGVWLTYVGTEEPDDWLL